MIRKVEEKRKNSNNNFEFINKSENNTLINKVLNRIKNYKTEYVKASKLKKLQKIRKNMNSSCGKKSQKGLHKYNRYLNKIRQINTKMNSIREPWLYCPHQRLRNIPIVQKQRKNLNDLIKSL